MLNLPKDFKDFVASLNAREVKYLIVGGYAVAFHGHPRMTGDIDFFVEDTEENGRKLQLALEEFGFSSLGLTFKVLLEPNVVIQLGFTPERIVILNAIDGVSFAEAWSNRVSVIAEGLTLLFVSKEDLISNKSATGRLKDRADIESLS